ncbi:MarR family winged helix-turn-helix transcriptional regulator [Aestuariispira insulae]|uniref:MarR family transcriptional regulator n=1 Tax=Aestuariispira insulae TaxID=1461337 RepID=A0A3D9HF26_9PROT|nr:MarR family transcriptional regulator [Aestuariispira insulae]RED48092.1 MarR family transcriptional regulator [Aestuariispira insulae]
MPELNDPPIFRLLGEIGIIEQLARTELERLLPDGLKASQFNVLNHLARLGGEWSLVRLANAFQVTRGAMTNTIQRLEARDLVHVSPDPEDGRSKLVSLTPQGLAVRQQAVTTVTPLLAALSAQLNDAEIERLLPLLVKVRQYLDENRSA